MPTYPFEGKRAWIDGKPASPVDVTQAAPAARPLPAAPAAPVVARAPANGAAVDAPPPPLRQTLVPMAAGALQAEITITANSIVIRTHPGQGAPAYAQQPHQGPQPLVQYAAPQAYAPQAYAPPAAAPPPVASVAAPPAPETAAPVDANEIEVRIAAAVEELLGVPEVNRNTRFTDLGADSLMMAQLLTRLRRTVFPSLTMKHLAAQPSITALARFVREASGAPVAAPAVAPPAPPVAAKGSNGEAQIESLIRDMSSLSAEEIERELAALGESDDDK